ncbi:flagellar hook-length control protein FliK, partial [Pseudomonas otitidis]|nr:flagellar hook-length control protein FliK [Pseudomonas otitidis]
MTEISTSRPVASVPTANRAAQAVADAALKLLQPSNGLLAAGDSAEAEVVSVKETAQNSFQVMLRLSLGSGQQATL